MGSAADATAGPARAALVGARDVSTGLGPLDPPPPDGGERPPDAPRSPLGPDDPPPLLVLPLAEARNPRHSPYSGAIGAHPTGAVAVPARQRGGLRQQSPARRR